MSELLALASVVERCQRGCLFRKHGRSFDFGSQKTRAFAQDDELLLGLGKHGERGA